MNCQMDDKPDHEEMYNLGDRISILTEMLIDLQARKNDGEISHAMYMNGLDMIERLSGGERIR